MAKKRKTKFVLSIVIVLILVLALGTTAYAKDYTGDEVTPGLSGIQPEDTLTLPENTDWATLTAVWGVRVKFLDWDEKELKNELIPVSEETPGSTVAPADPSRSGYVFKGWKRYDSNSGPATLGSDGKVTGIDGPGPIVFIAEYTYIPDPPAPEDPVTPPEEEPEEPVTPPEDEPAEPEDPADPEDPAEPEDPVTPVTPVKPVKPVKPTPEVKPEPEEEVSEEPQEIPPMPTEPPEEAEFYMGNPDIPLGQWVWDEESGEWVWVAKKLPQTGQTSWPVTAFGLIGMASVIAGITVRRKENSRQ